MLKPGTKLSTIADFDHAILHNMLVDVYQDDQCIAANTSIQEHNEDVVKIDGDYYLKFSCDFIVRESMQNVLYPKGTILQYPADIDNAMWLGLMVEVWEDDKLVDYGDYIVYQTEFAVRLFPDKRGFIKETHQFRVR